ncbi:hypothetical protein TRAPUB_4834 [Trametes pubescens]|uniref:Uncharacterized protein n=1 Tax=Trametes pubescens TaxID=154538 RepID=A0A1M2VAD4_TRAPU|nr:hypothetical protein TRAPUB_4834 [Trametes pubescens]
MAYYTSPQAYAPPSAPPRRVRGGNASLASGPRIRGRPSSVRPRPAFRTRARELAWARRARKARASASESTPKGASEVIDRTRTPGPLGFASASETRLLRQPCGTRCRYPTVHRK